MLSIGDVDCIIESVLSIVAGALTRDPQGGTTLVHNRDLMVFS